MSQVKITLPSYIENIFQNSSIDGEIDYLKNIFDDRDINMQIYYDLNCEIYRNLVINKKFNDKDFLRVKKTLFYIFTSSTKNTWRVDFRFSEFYTTEAYNSVDFIDKELNESWTDFDKFYWNFFWKRNDWDKIYYIKKIQNLHNDATLFFSEILKLFRSKTWYDVFEKTDTLMILKKILSEGYDILDEITYEFEGVDFTEHINFLINLYTPEEILKILNRNTDDDPLYYNYVYDILPTILSNQYWLEWYFKSPDNLKNAIKNIINSNLIRYLHNIVNRNNNLAIQFLEDIDVKDKFIDQLGWENNVNGNKGLDFETMEIVIEIINIKWWEQYIIKSFGGIDKFEEKMEFLLKWTNYSKLHELYEKLFEKNYIQEEIRWKNENDEVKIKKYLLENPRQLSRLCILDSWVAYLRSLNVNKTILEKIIKNKNESWTNNLIDQLFDTKEGVLFIHELNKDGDLDDNGILINNLVLSVDRAKRLNELWTLYKNEMIRSLKENTLDDFFIVFEILQNSPAGIQLIMDLNLEKKIAQEMIYTTPSNRFPRYFIWDLGLNFLKNILNIETNAIKNQVYDFIKTSDSGSCLLSWYRWTWKTSLLNGIVKKLQEEDDEDIVKVVINIPEQKKDDNGNKKSFNKNELITRIIREMYHALIKNNYPKRKIADFEEQYIRTFKQIEDIEGFIHLKKRWFLRIAIDVLSFMIPIFMGLLMDYVLWMLSVKIFGHPIWLWIDFLKLLVAWLLIVLNFLVFRTLLNVSYKARMERTLYNEDIAEFRLSENILDFKNGKSFFSRLKRFIELDFYKKKFKEFYKFLKGIVFSRKRKFVIIIDELDKLLDLDKWIGKWNLDMWDIFDLLWKLKTLFFDNSWAIFFIVTNKDAYNYYLENKHSEDDLVSNIFNKVLYLPMIERGSFNINRTFHIDWIEESSQEDNKRNHEYFNKWLYFKSHWNWRKANFILNQKLNGKEVVFEKDYMDYDMRFYDFTNILYELFLNHKDAKKKFNDNFVPGKHFYEFINTFILKDKHANENEYFDNYKGIIQKLRQSLELIGKDTKYTEINKKIDNLVKKYTDSNPFEVFSYMHSSVEKISNQFAYRDFILNSILSIIEILKHDKGLRVEDILLKLKFTEVDINSPAFEDLVLIYIPFMVFYFNSPKEYDTID